MTSFPIIGTLPTVCFPLLDALRTREPQEAARIEDRYWFVLEGIKEDEIKDWEMVTWLLEAITDAFDRTTPPRVRLTRRGSRWDLSEGDDAYER